MGRGARECEGRGGGPLSVSVYTRGVWCVFTSVAVRCLRVPPQAGRWGRGRQSSGAQTPHFTEEGQEEDTLACSQSPRSGSSGNQIMKPCPRFSVRSRASRPRESWSGFKTSRTAPQLRETPPHPSLAFMEAVTVGFVGSLGTVWCGADVLSHSVSDSLRPRRL